MEEWEIWVTDEFREWFATLDDESQNLVSAAIDRLADTGPQLGRPLVDRITSSKIHNLKELRPASSGRSEVRILFVFDPWRSAIMLVGGDKSGTWSAWYQTAIPQAERLYAEYLQDREEEDRKS